jgi:hypothetical protein
LLSLTIDGCKIYYKTTFINKCFLFLSHSLLVASKVPIITDTVTVWDKNTFCQKCIMGTKRAEFQADFKSDFYYCVQMFLAYDFFRWTFGNF